MIPTYLKSLAATVRDLVASGKALHVMNETAAELDLLAGLPWEHVLRDDIGPDIDMRPIIEYAGTLYDQCRTDGVSEYTNGSSCANPETLRLCPVCAAVRIIYSDRQQKRSQAQKGYPVKTEPVIAPPPLPKRPAWCATASYPQKLTEAEHGRLTKALRMELLTTRDLRN